MKSVNPEKLEKYFTWGYWIKANFPVRFFTNTSETSNLLGFFRKRQDDLYDIILADEQPFIKPDGMDHEIHGLRIGTLKYSRSNGDTLPIDRKYLRKRMTYEFNDPESYQSIIPRDEFVIAIYKPLIDIND